jgi:uncharacterized protein YjbI with pentapeptide repeats
MTLCRMHKNRLIECPQEIWEGDPEELCLLHSRQTSKGQDGKFSEAIKRKIDEEDYDFRGVFFPGYNKFPQFNFNKKIDFSWAAFKRVDFAGAASKDARFHRSDFHEVRFFLANFKYVDFSRAKFGEVDFSEGNFQEASFYKSEFQEADFTLATFNSANFSESTFLNGNFIDTVFQEADFSRVKITGQIKFIGIRSERSAKEKEPWFANFQSLEFAEKGVLKLIDLSLAHAQFKGTDLRRVEFYDVSWPSWWWRLVVYDEIQLHQRKWAYISYLLKYGGLWRKRNHFKRLENKPKRKGLEHKPKTPSSKDFEAVERLYRQLKTNYEEERDLKRVGDFHYGEMEMHRRGSTWRWFPLYWYNLYWLSSGYGECPLRAVLTLAGLLLAFSILFLKLENGLESLGGWNWSGLWNSLLYVFQQGTLQRPDWLKPATAGGKFLAALMPILIPGQAALFLLALRNRLGRRR